MQQRLDQIGDTDQARLIVLRGVIPQIDPTTVGLTELLLLTDFIGAVLAARGAGTVGAVDHSAA